MLSTSWLVAVIPTRLLVDPNVERVEQGGLIEDCRAHAASFRSWARRE